jgi:histidine ammonia-lyase
MEFLRPLRTTVPLEEVYRLVRRKVKPWDCDRFMAPDIDAVTEILRNGEIWLTVKSFVDKFYDKEVCPSFYKLPRQFVCNILFHMPDY